MKINSKLEVNDLNLRNREFSTKKIREILTSELPGDPENQSKLVIYIIAGKNNYQIHLEGNFLRGIDSEDTLKTWFNTKMDQLDKLGYSTFNKKLNIMR